MLNYPCEKYIKTRSHQSNNIIVDLRRCGLPQDHAIRELEQRFELSKRLRNMMIITNDEKIIDFTKS